MRRLMLCALLSLSACDNMDGFFPTEAAKARNAVRDKLKDPESANFKDMYKCPSNSEMWTGQVNSKNSYGAYGGFDSFIVKHASAVFWSNPMYDDYLKDCYKGDPILKEMLRYMPSDVERWKGQ